MTKRKFEFDEIGYWSEIKLDIVKKYAKAYSTILSNQPGFTHYYIDGFAGRGVHVSKATREFVAGSPLNALLVRPPFKHHFLVDLDGSRIARLRELVGSRGDVTLLAGDCNEVLLREVFPLVQYSQRRRALCLLDPYGMHVSWELLATAGRLKTIDLFLNFPIMDINRNALWSRRGKVKDTEAARLSFMWGDLSWQEVAYRPSRQETLFGEAQSEKAPNQAIVEAFRNRLQKVAGFRNVPSPMPMRNTTNAVVYYLFFASPNDTANKIVQDIFARYEGRRSDARGS